MVDLDNEAFCQAVSLLGQVPPFRQAQLLICDEDELINWRLPRLNLSQVVHELALNRPEALLPPREVHGRHATTAILRAQDVRPTILATERMTWIKILVAISQQKLRGEMF